MREDSAIEAYEVGYGKPPKSSQFKKGVSGNPSGRRKKPSNFDAKLLRELNSPLTINENGKRKVITKDEGIVKQAVNRAIGGHVPSMRMMNEWRRQAVENTAAEEQHAQELANRTAKDYSDEELQAMLRAAEKRRSAQLKTDARLHTR